MALASAYTASCTRIGVEPKEYVVRALEAASGAEEREVALDGSYYAYSRQRLVDEDVEALSEALSGSSSSAVRVSLRNHRITDVGARALARAVGKGAISALDLSGNLEVGLDGYAVLAEAVGSEESVCVDLVLRRTQGGDAGALELAKVVTKLEGLDVGACRLCCRGLVGLLAELREKEGGLLRLGLDSPELGVGYDDEDVATHLGLWLASPSCRCEVLSASSWPRASRHMAHRIAEALESNGSLRRLSLSSCRLSAEGVAILARAAATHPLLTSVELAATRAGDEGGIAWAETIASEGSPLSHLDLRNAEIGEKGLLALVQAASSASSTSTPIRLQLWGNQWTPKAALALEEAIQEGTIRPASSPEGEHPLSTIDADTFRVDESKEGVRVARAE